MAAQRTDGLGSIAACERLKRVLHQARNPAVRACYEHWLRARSRCGRDLPGLHDLDPLEDAVFFPYLLLTEVVRRGGHCRFRHKIVGTHFKEILGREITGKFIEHAGWLQIFDGLYRRFSLVVDEKVLIYGTTRLPELSPPPRPFEHLTLPLASNGDTVDMLLGVRCALPLGEAPSGDSYESAPLPSS